MPVIPLLHTAHLPDGSAAVLDLRTGRGTWQHLNSTAALLWRRHIEGTPMDRAVEELTASFAAEGADPEVVSRDLAALTAQLAGLGLTSAPAAPVPATGRARVRTALPNGHPLRAADRACGAAGLVVALVLLRCAPIRFSVRTARLLTRLPRRPAAPERADRLFAAVREAARLWPDRAACLEESLACYLAGVLRGARVSWVIGARTSPVGAHAWNEADGWVIGQDPGERTWPYAPALRIRGTNSAQ